MVASNLIIREYRDGDENQINTLHNMQYQKDRGLDQWLWLFKQSPWGPAVYVVAEDNGRIIGTQAVMPIPFVCGGREVLSGKSEDTLLAPEYRGKGIFRELYSKAFDGCRQRGISFVWGFTEAAEPFRRCGFEIPAAVNQLIAPLSPVGTYRWLCSMASRHLTAHRAMRPVLRAALAGTACLWYAKWMVAMVSRKARNRNGLQVVSVTDPGLGLQDLWQEMNRGKRYVTVCRTLEYLRWRIFENRAVEYTVLAALSQKRVCGYVVLSTEKPANVGYITDFCVLDNAFDAASEALSTAAMQYFRSQHVAAIRTSFLGANPEEKRIVSVLMKAGFSPVRRGESLVIKVLDEAIAGRARTAEEWLYSRILSLGVEN